LFNDNPTVKCSPHKGKNDLSLLVNQVRRSFGLKRAYEHDRCLLTGIDTQCFSGMLYQKAFCVLSGWISEETDLAAPKEIVELVERFESNREAYKSGHYNETQVRREFVDPLFKALGWDIDNEQGFAEAYKYVIHEDAIKVGGTTRAPGGPHTP